MAWGDNGITVKRQLLDQTAPFTWGASPVNINFRNLRTAGYLRELKLWLPQTAFAITHGAGTNQLQPSAQLAGYRAIQRFRMGLQGIALLYDVSGLDLYALNYMRSGQWASQSGLTNYNIQSAAAPPNGGTTPGAYATTLATVVNTSLTYCAYIPIPLVEYIRIKDAVLSSGDNHVVVADKETEVGFLTLQNASSNIQPSLVLNPLYSTTVDAPLLVTGNDVASGNATWFLSGDTYDVPELEANQPQGMSQMYVITRQSFDTPISGGGATINFLSAGSIMRIAYEVFDTNNNLVDFSSMPSAGGNVMDTAKLSLKYGATTLKFDEYLHENAARAYDRYFVAPPQGMLFHDFMTDDGTATDFVDTVAITNLRCDLTGFTNATKVTTLVERLVPVTAG